MELLYKMLWKGCAWFLLSFLVSRLISLIVSFSDDDDSDDRLEISVSWRNNKRIKFHDDQPAKFQPVKDEEVLLVRDIDVISDEVNVIDQDLELFHQHINKELEKGGEFGEEFVDQTQEELNFVGFENNVGGKLESGENIVADKNVENFGVVSESEQVVVHDDGREKGNCSNVGEGEISGRGFDIDNNKGALSDDEEWEWEWEWEGIERSELEKKFAKAMNFVECRNKEGMLIKLAGNDVMIHFYGLQKIAMEGQCHDPQPIPLKLSARAKWNAWNRLGFMTREEAMDEYIKLLSDSIPEWMEDHSSGKE